jgi:type II secretory pathway component GspD/PulD (secretin)
MFVATRSVHIPFAQEPLMSKHLAFFFLLASFVVVSAAARADDPPAAKNKHIVYVVKFGAAKDVATVLAKQFKGEAEIEALSDSPANCLLISASPAVFEEITKILGELDKRPMMVAIDLTVAEVSAKKGEDASALEEKDFTGPAQQVMPKFEALRRSGTLANIRRMQLTGVENKAASILSGETKSVVTGVHVTGTGMSTKSIMMRQVGTKVDATPRVAADKSIMLDLNVDESYLRVPDDAPVLGKDDTGAPIRASETVMATLKTHLTLAPGQVVTVKMAQRDSKAGVGQTLVLVTARIVE